MLEEVVVLGVELLFLNPIPQELVEQVGVEQVLQMLLLIQHLKE
jgi:hypothetical protein